MKKYKLSLITLLLSIIGMGQGNSELLEPQFQVSQLVVEANNSKNHSSLIKAPGDIVWGENFSNGFPAGWTLEDNAGIGGWVYIDADTMYSGAHINGDFSMQGNTPGGYMHLPADYYNCVPGTWPRVTSSNLVNIDASMTTDWLNITYESGGLILKYATFFVLCCHSVDAQIEVSVTVDGSTWKTYNSRDINGEIISLNSYPSQSQLASYPEYFIPDSFLNNSDSIKIKFHMHGASHYFWSIDDVQLIEPQSNDIRLKEVFMADSVYVTESNISLNSRYSSIPGNIIADMTLGALVHQSGDNAENLRVNFDASINEGSVSVWSSGSNILSNYSGYENDTVLISPENNKFYLYNPEITSDVDYTLTYTLESDNADLDVSDNTISYPFKQTVGRYSYHWQTNCDAESSSQIGPFSYVGTSPNNGDVLANKFEMYCEQGDEFKIYGLRFFLPTQYNYVSFDAAGNGVTISPVVYKYDESANNGDGQYIPINEIVGTPYTLEITDTNSYVYLSFDEEIVNSFQFENGIYLLGFRIDDYNNQQVSVGVDNTFRQGRGTFFMNLINNNQWYYYDADGSVMIDAYTNMQAYLDDQTDDCISIPEADFSCSSQLVAVGDIVFFQDNSIGDVTSWYWEFETSSGFEYSTEQSPNIVYNQEGTYNVSLTVSNDMGSDNRIEENYIQVYVPLTVGIETTDAYCGVSNGVADANVCGGSGNYSYLWSNGNTSSYIENLEEGMHMLTVTDNDYGIVSVDTAIIQNNEIQVLSNISNNICTGNENGAIELLVLGGQPPYTYIWDDCQNTQYIDSLSSGIYYYTVSDVNNCQKMDSVIVTEPYEMEVSFLKTLPTCGNMDGVVFANVAWGVPPYTYIWSDNLSTENTITGIGAGMYQLTVEDANGCIIESKVSLNNNDTVVITIDSLNAVACNSTGNAYITVEEASGLETYLWSNGDVTEDLLNVVSGEYILELTDGNCKTYTEVEVPLIKPLTQEICMVTYDTISGSDLLIWEKIQFENIDYYNIYKRNVYGGNWNYVDAVTFDEMSVYSVPEICNQNYEYRISAVDVCGNESDYSSTHKPINLIADLSTDGNSMHIEWDNYIGFEYNNYQLYRYSMGMGWELIAELPSSENSYIDNDYWGLQEIKYSVSVESPNGCTPSSTSKAIGNTYYYSSSNIVDEEMIYLSENEIESESLQLELYPNPNSGHFIIGFNDDYSGEIEIIDISGKQIYKDAFSNIKKWTFEDQIESGVYMIRVVVDNNATKTLKMIVE
jgi:PKD repeat protein